MERVTKIAQDEEKRAREKAELEEEYEKLVEERKKAEEAASPKPETPETWGEWFRRKTRWQ